MWGTPPQKGLGGRTPGALTALLAAVRPPGPLWGDCCCEQCRHPVLFVR